jgi:hypothetical protein
MTKLQRLIELATKQPENDFYCNVFKEIYEFMNQQIQGVLPPLESIYLRFLSEADWYEYVMSIDGRLTIEDTAAITKHHKVLSNGRMVFCYGSYVVSINKSMLQRAYRISSQFGNVILNYVIFLIHELLHLVDESAEHSIEGELRLHRRELEIAEEFLGISFSEAYKKNRKYELRQILRKKYLAS